MKFDSLLSVRGIGCATVSVLLLSSCAGARTRYVTAEYVGPSGPAVTGLQVLPRSLASNIAPIYPRSMRATATPALVKVDCVIDETGRLLMAAVESSTNVAFNKPTMDAVRGWSFEPGTRDGVATMMRVTLPVEFIMER